MTAYLITRSHNDLSPAFYLMAAAQPISLLVILRLRDRAGAAAALRGIGKRKAAGKRGSR